MRGQASTTTGGRHGAIGAIAAERDRERAFRRARRHSILVRLLKIALPATAVICLGVYVGTLVVTSALKGGDIQVGAISVDTTSLRMADPRYTGFAKDGSEYRIHAQSAVTDLRMAAPVRLEVIDGEIIQPSGVITKLKAAWGTYDQKKDLLELYERIDVDANNGMRARLTRATVLAKESRILSPEPVEAETQTGDIRANTMTLDSKARRAAFRDAVVVTLRPARPAAQLRGAEPLKPRRESTLIGLDASSGEPVVVTADALDVDDNARTALFRQRVVARQGEAQLEAPELDVHYIGRATAVPGAQPAGPGPEGQEATRLKSMQARGGVVMTSRGDRAESATLDYDAENERILLGGNVVMTQLPERRVTAETALLDQRADTALLNGEVVVTQGRNVMRGGRLAIDRKAGTARLASPAASGRPAGRISTLLYQSQPDRPTARKTKTEEAEESPLGAFGAGFKSDPNAPIEVDAAVLDVNDRRQQAVYTGAVVAKQGAFVVRTEEMTAYYTGDTGLLAGTGEQAPRDKTKGAGPGSSQLKRIEARRNVIVTGNDGQQATGEWADFDVKANKIIMGGKVTVTQGKQVVRAPEGHRLVIDLDTGLTKLEAEPGAAAKGGPQVSGAFSTSVAPTPGAGAAGSGNAIACPPGAVCKSGRLEAIFYPHQLKEKAKDKAKERLKADPDLARDAAEAADSARSIVKRRPSGSSWSSTGEPATRPRGGSD